jgi:hypothetical protein
MALINEYNQPETGLLVLDTYVKVSTISIYDKTKLHFDTVISTSKGVSAFQGGSYICNYNIEGENPIKQAYLHLKTLPEFADAVDA